MSGQSGGIWPEGSPKGRKPWLGRWAPTLTGPSPWNSRAVPKERLVPIARRARLQARFLAPAAALGINAPDSDACAPQPRRTCPASRARAAHLMQQIDLNALDLQQPLPLMRHLMVDLFMQLA